MTKEEVVKSLKIVIKEKGINSLQTAELVKIHDAVFENLSNILAAGHAVSIVNFGTFKSNYETKFNLNKRIKENVNSTIQAFVLKFSCSLSLKDKLNGRK